MAQAGYQTPFFKRRRNVLTVMVFLLMFIFPSLRESQPFQRSIFPLEVINLFTLSNLLTQLFGGFVAMKFGGHQAIFCAAILSSFRYLSMPLLPVLSHSFDYTTVFAITGGLFQGAIMPSLLVMWSKWLPPVERFNAIGVAFSGAYVGQIFSYHMPQYLIRFRNADAANLREYYYYYYFLGCAGLLWAILWKYLVRNSPEMDPFIKFEERHFIRTALSGQSTHKIVPVPWKSMFTSTAVLAIIVTTFVQNWTYFTFLIDIPNLFTYLQTPYIVIGTTTFVAGFVIVFAQKICKRSTIGKARRQFVCISHILQIICVVLAFTFASQWDQVNAMLTFKLIGLGITTLVSVRITISYLEIAPQFAGVLFGICSFVAGFLGVIRPLITLIFVETGFSYATAMMAQEVVLSCFLGAGAMIYWFFGQTDILPWAVQEIVIYYA